MMSTFREKAQGRTKQVVGQMIGDQKLVEEGKAQVDEAERMSHAADRPTDMPASDQRDSDSDN